MKQLCVRFDEKTFQILQKNADEKALKIAEYIRRLIDVGLRLETISASKSEENNGEENKISELGEVKKLWEHSLAWALETRLLTRLLMREVSKKSEEELLSMVNTLTDKAENHVAGLLDQRVDTE